MFDFVRTHNRILQVALGLLIIPSFAIFGIQGYTHLMGDGSAEIASVDGKDITQSEWDTYRRRVLDQARERNPSVDPKQFDTPEAKRAALDAMVRERVLQAAEYHQALEASDERVRLALQKNPDFAALRAMDPAQRNAALASRGLTPDSFFDNIRVALTQAQVLRGVESSSLVPAVTVKAGLDAFYDQREIQWQLFAPKDYAAAIQPTEAEIQAWYADKAHASDFLAPEEAKIEYLLLDPESLKAQVAPTEAELKKYYDEHQKLFSSQEERHVSHILVNVDPEVAAGRDREGQGEGRGAARRGAQEPRGLRRHRQAQLRGRGHAGQRRRPRLDHARHLQGRARRCRVRAEAGRGQPRRCRATWASTSSSSRASAAAAPRRWPKRRRKWPRR